MGDFLADIVERSIATEQAIRPRSLSAFEPMPATTFADTVHQIQPEQNNAGPKSSAVGTVSMKTVAVVDKEFPVSQSESHTDDGEATQLKEEVTASAPLHVSSNPGEQSSRRYKPRPAEMLSPPAQLLSAAAKLPIDKTISPAVKIKEKPSHESPNNRGSTNPLTQPLTQKGIYRDEMEFGAPEPQRKVTGAISDQVLDKPAIVRVESKGSLPSQPRRQSIVPQHSWLATASGKSHGSREQKGAEPTIQVTIGRVEVRAVTQAVANPPKPKGPAPMGLEEYLRGRNGGGR